MMTSPLPARDHHLLSRQTFLARNLLTDDDKKSASRFRSAEICIASVSSHSGRDLLLLAVVSPLLASLCLLSAGSVKYLAVAVAVGADGSGSFGRADGADLE